MPGPQPLNLHILCTPSDAARLLEAAAKVGISAEELASRAITMAVARILDPWWRRFFSS